MRFRQYSSIIVICLLFRGVVNAAEFDPNYIISDAELQSYQGYTVTDIQSILSNHDSYLAVYQAPDVRGTLRTAAEIIHQAAWEHRINPKYLLTTLQKEQSLITDTSPTEDQLDWATGYGICDNCSKRDPSLQKHRGFGTQVDSAAGIMRWYYDNLHQSFVKKAGNTYSIDGQTIIPASHATGFLYTYTPHIQGNLNFWKIWQSWFGARHPDGTLFEDRLGRLYLIEDGRKRVIDSPTFDLKEYNIRNRLTATDAILAKYESGDPIRDNGQRLINWGGGFFLVDGDTIHRFDSIETMEYHHIRPVAVPIVDDQEFFRFTRGEEITRDTLLPLGGLVRLRGTDTHYYIRLGKLYPISDHAIIKANYATEPIREVAAEEIAPLTLAKPVKLKDGTLFGVTGHNLIYTVEHGKKRHISSEEAFTSYGYDWNNVHWVSPLTGINHPTGQPLTGLVPTNLVTAGVSVTSPSVIRSTTEKNAHMRTTSAKDTVYTGNQRFTTDIDSYLVADATTGAILAGKNIDVRRPLASLVKMMTAYRLYAEGINTNASVRYTPSLHRSVYHRFRIAPGESYLNQDLFFSFLVSSLNTPGKMLVSSVEDDETAFIERMNEQVKRWGLTKTVFTDVTGENLGNIGSARDYLTIFRHTANNVDVRYFSSRPSYEYYELVDMDGEPRHFDNHSNTLVQEQDRLPFRIIASKTGYLDEAGDNLAMLIERPSDGKQFIMITLGNPYHGDRFTEPERLARWIIGNF